MSCSVPELPNPVIHEILVHCDTKTLSNFQLVSRDANHFVNKFRRFYKPINVFSCSFWKNDNIRNIVICKESNQNETTKILSENEDFSTTAYKIQPDWFIFQDDDELLKLTLNWWKKIKKVEISFEQPRIKIYYPIFSMMSNVLIEYNFKANANDILVLLPSIQSFVYRSNEGPGLTCDAQTLDIITKKSFKGDGLVNIYITCDEQSVLPAKCVANLITKSKLVRSENGFSRMCLFLSHVNGTKADFCSLIFNDPTISAFSGDGDDSYFLIRMASGTEIIFTTNEWK